MDPNETETTNATEQAATTETATAATSDQAATTAAAEASTETATTTAATEQASTTPAEPVIPEGYVKAEDVETERTARTAAEARAEAAETRARETEIRLHAQELGFADVTDAQRFIGADVADIKAALAAVLESKPYLKGAAAQPVTPTSPTSPARSASALPTFTQAQISDRAFWSANKDAIRVAMRDGRIVG